MYGFVYMSEARRTEIEQTRSRRLFASSFGPPPSSVGSSCVQLNPVPPPPPLLYLTFTFYITFITLLLL